MWTSCERMGKVTRNYRKNFSKLVRFFSLDISKFSLYSTFNWTFTSRSKFNSSENRCMKMSVPISSLPPGSSFSTNSGVDFHHSEFHRRLLKHQWYYITLRDSQCIGRQSIPIFHPEPKVNTMKIHKSDIPFERSRVYKIKIGIDSKKRKERSNRRYEHSYERSSLRDASNEIRFDD